MYSRSNSSRLTYFMGKKKNWTALCPGIKTWGFFFYVSRIVSLSFPFMRKRFVSCTTYTFWRHDKCCTVFIVILSSIQEDFHTTPFLHITVHFDPDPSPAFQVYSILYSDLTRILRILSCSLKKLFGIEWIRETALKFAVFGLNVACWLECCRFAWVLSWIYPVGLSTVLSVGLNTAC